MIEGKRGRQSLCQTVTVVGGLGVGVLWFFFDNLILFWCILGSQCFADLGVASSLGVEASQALSRLRLEDDLLNCLSSI